MVGRLQDQGEAPQTALTWMQQTIDHLEKEQLERAWLMKRDWSDSAFEDGEAGNEATLEKFEVELVGMLQSSGQGLGNANVLGSAIDLAGAYKKNYKLDKSEAVLLRCTRHAELRSGAWLVKYLNHISQVRMKQSRDTEAMEMMYEMESLANFPMSEPGASTFYETLYRNMSSALRRMNREDEAAMYFMKMVEASRYHKETLDWMDLWDLGLLIANRSFQGGHWEEFYKSREILAEALRQQQVVEPAELILRAKVLSNLGQCFLATEEYAEADIHYSEAYDLFNDCVGKRSPLFGMQAWACANLRYAEGRYLEALPLLGEALYVEVVKDGLSVPEMTKLLDLILTSLHECREQLQGGDHAGQLEAFERSVATLDEDPRWAALEDVFELALLAHKMALALIAGGSLASSRGLGGCAGRFSERAVAILRTSKHHEAPSWLAQAEAIRSSALAGAGAAATGRR